MKLEVHAIKLNFENKMDSFLMDKLMNRVDSTKEAKLRRFVREEDKIRGLFGDLMVRDLIRRKTGLPNHKIEFGTNDYGKPFLKNQAGFHFNISHSGEWVVVAIDDRAVGIDIEEIQHIDLGISQDYFSEEEHRDLMNHSDRLSYFFTLWSLKESYIKILGKGLSHPLNAFSIGFDPEGKITLKVGGRLIDNTFFTQYNLDKKYKMGLCATHNHLPQDVNIATMEEMIQRFSTVFAPRRTRYHVAARQFHPAVRKTRSVSPVNSI